METPLGLVVPDHVAEDLAKEQELDRQEGMAVAANRILRQKDPGLSLVFAKENATDPQLTPGRWHIERQNSKDAPNSYIPITGPNGEYIEPSIDHILNRLNERDMWKPGAIQRIYEAKAKEKREDRQKIEDAMEEAKYEAKITAKVIMGQHQRKRKNASAAARGRDNLPDNL